MNLQAFEIPQLSLVRVAGADAIKVLNGLCTAKLVELTAGNATEAMFTDDRGRVLAHGIVALEPHQAAAWFVGQAFDAAKIAAHIDRFIFREDASPQDVTNSWRGWLLDANSPINHGTNSDWSALAEKLGVPAEAGCATLEILGQEAMLVRFPATGPQSRLLLVPQALPSELPTWFEQMDIQPGSPDEFEDRRIRNFWPLASSEMSERTLPQELDRDLHAVSFTKGCYLGQETVARLDAMGEVQRKLCLVELNGSSEVTAGQVLMRDGKEVGKLHSVSPIQHSDKRWALASMRRGSMSPGSQFTVGSIDEAAASLASGVVTAHP